MLVKIIEKFPFHVVNHTGFLMRETARWLANRDGVHESFKRIAEEKSNIEKQIEAEHVFLECDGSRDFRDLRIGEE